jgi:hypothetical protein
VVRRSPTTPAVSTRAVQLALLPDHAGDRPVGPVLGSVFTGTNADLMAAVAPLYLTGSVLDTTYGDGGWWRRFTPDPFTAHDLHKLDGVDFRRLPEPDGSVDAVCFDPPYVPQGGTAIGGAGAADFRDRFGLTTESTPWWQVRDLIIAGVAECARVARRWVLVKCTDFVTGSTFYTGHKWVEQAADTCGLGDPWDVIIHHTGSGPGGHNIFTPVRARRHHSYLLVFGIDQ